MGDIYDVNGHAIVIGSGGSEAKAKEILTGKVLIALGDSYTVGMSSQLSALASKYGMILDNRGVVSSSISTSTTAPMCNRADDLVTEYTSGKTMDGQTYYTDDVAIITLMGGANDGPGIANGIGTGVHETDISTIYGALNHIFSVLQENFTKATIIAILQPSNYVFTQSSIESWITSDEIAQRIGFDTMAEALVMSPVQLSNYVQAIKEYAVRNAAWYYEVELLDMFAEFPSVLNPSNRTKYWQNDRLHLTTVGYDYIKNAINKKIVELFGQGVTI